MALRVPKNQTITKYTSGGEYVIANTGVRYQGYYCEVGGKVYTEKEYNPSTSLLLIKPASENYNQLLSKPNTFIYSAISNAKVNYTNKITSLPTENIINIARGGDIPDISFYIKKINDNIIKKIDENTYLNFQSNPLYVVTYIGTYKDKYQSIDDAEKVMPGIKIFILN